MDRQAWIVVTLCALGLIGVMMYNAKNLPQPARSSAGPTPGQSAEGAAPISSPSPSPTTPTPTPAASVAPFAEEIETLRNSDVELRLTNRGGAISEAVLLKHSLDNGDRVALNSSDRMPIGAIVEQPSAPVLPEFTLISQTEKGVQFERKTSEALSIRKSFSILVTPEKKDEFVAEMSVEFRNEGTEAYTNSGYFVTLGSTRPLHQSDMPAYTRLVWCNDGKPKATDVSWFDAQNYWLVGVEKRAAQSVFQEKVNGAEWAAMSNQFFTTIITPLDGKVIAAWAQPFGIPNPPGPPLRCMDGAMEMPGFQLEPGHSTTQRFQLYLGPKLYHRLAKLEHDEAEIMNFGMWKLVSQFLLNFMNLIHSWVHDYGFSIIILTACVKGVLWPLQNKANQSMRKMQTLQPKMQELKEKYKDDPTRMNQELMKLYKEHGVNPVGGCLPMLIQIPIFFGLFSMLGQAAELRNASFLWVRDLSQPDTVAHLPGLGWKINLLPLLMGATNLWLMRMTPKTGDATQQRVLMFMPLIFLIFCYNFAAALALYYTTLNLFTILQFYQNRKQPLPALAKVAATEKKSRKRR